MMGSNVATNAATCCDLLAPTSCHMFMCSVTFGSLGGSLPLGDESLSSYAGGSSMFSMLKVRRGILGASGSRKDYFESQTLSCAAMCSRNFGKDESDQGRTGSITGPAQPVA